MRSSVCLSLTLATIVLSSPGRTCVSAPDESRDAVAQSGSAAAAGDLALARQATALLDTKCFGCHNHGWRVEGSKPMKMLSWGQDVPRMVKDRLIVPGKPDESRLNKYVALLTHPGSVPSKRPTAEEARMFADWIAKGAADPKSGTPPSHPASPPVSP